MSLIESILLDGSDVDKPALRDYLAAQEVVSITDPEFGAVGDDAATNTAAIQEALDSLTSGGYLAVQPGIFRSGALTVSNDDVTILLQPGAVLKFPTLGAGAKAITVAADSFEITGKGKLQGPATGAYVAAEYAIYSAGTSVAAPRTGLRVNGIEITAFGDSAVYGKFLRDVIVEKNYIHHVGYAGVQVMSSVDGDVLTNRIETISPGDGSGNAYGITLTHISTAYHTLPGTGTKAATNPFCWDWTIDNNHIEDINWAGIDTHGGYEITVSNNRVYATKRGIEVAGGSGDAIAYAGWSNQIVGNIVDGSNFDGTDSGRRNMGVGIGVNGGATLKHSRVLIANNIVRYKGVLGNTTSGAISAQATIGAIIHDNFIDMWGGSGIHYGNSTGGTRITDNTFGPIAGASAGSEYCIHTDTADTQFPTITGNTIAVNGGTAPVDGFRGSSIVNLPYFEDNDFSGVSSSQYTTPSKFLMRSEGLPALAVAVSNAGGGAAVDVDAGSMARYKQFIINVTSANALSEIKDLTNTVIGQRIALHSPAATAWTFLRTNAALAGGASFVAGQYDTLDLIKMLDTGVKFVEMSRAANS